MKTYKNKFFDKIGYKHSSIETLLYNMTEHIYIWLKMYYKYANKRINLDFHKFTIDGKEFTERECICSS